MAGFGLSDAVSNYIQGVQQRQVMDERQKQLDSLNSANKAFQDSLDADKATWALNGAGGNSDAQWMPSDADYLRAAQARQASFAQSGDVNNYMKSSAQLSPMLARMRQNALDASGGDEVALAKAIYPTYLDNHNLAGADMVDGTGPDGKTKTQQLRLTMDDGSTRFLPAGKLTDMVTHSIMTPEARLAEAKYLYDLKKEAAKAGEDRKTEGVKQQGRLELAGYNREAQSDLESQKQSGRIALADFNDGITLGHIAAQGAEARKTKQTPGADGGGDGSGASNSLALRTIQQQRMRLDARRKDAKSAFDIATKAAALLPYLERAPAVKAAQDNYGKTMAGLDNEDRALVKRLNSLPGGGGDDEDTPTVPPISSYDSSPSGTPAAQTKKPALSSYYRQPPSAPVKSSVGDRVRSAAGAILGVGPDE